MYVLNVQTQVYLNNHYDFILKSTGVKGDDQAGKKWKGNESVIEHAPL